MAYVKNTWVDQQGQVRYTETEDDGYKIFTANYEEVTEIGTPVNADNMNHIEQGIFDNNVHIGDLTQLETDTKTDLVSAINEAMGIAFRNIGEVIPSTIPLTDAGLHLLDGALISGSGSYNAFVTYIASIYDASASYFCTEQEWQASVTQYGVCGKFVYNSINNTVRLPKYNNKIYTGGGTAPVIGNGKGLGLTNGSVSGTMVGTQSANCGLVLSNSVALGQYVNNTSTITSASIQNGVTGVTTDANNSGLIAQLSNITTSLDGYYYIVIATSTKTDIEVDIDEIATDLNGKADVDLTNTVPAQSFINGSMGWTRIDFANGISLTINSDYTCPSDGCLYVRSVHVEGAAIPKLTINSTTFDTAIASGGYVDTSTFFVSVSKNDVVKLSAGYTIQQLMFFPLKGVA